MCGTSHEDWQETRFAYDVEYEYCAGCERLEWASKDDTKVRAGVRPVLMPSRTLLKLRGL